MKSGVIRGAMTAAVAMCHCSSYGEDIDLFVGSPLGPTDLPNVLFIIDNTANWTPRFENEKAALVNTFQTLPVNPSDGSARFNIGVMFAAETSSADSNVDGGYVRAALRPMNATNKALYAAMIASLDVNRDKGNGGASSLVMAEAYRYLSGGAAYAGKDKAKADYTGNTGADWSSSATTLESLAAMQAIYALTGNALSAKSATTYDSPIGDGCGRNYIIYITNGASQDNNSTVVTSTTMLADAGGDTTQIALSPSGSQGNPSDEWARFMKASLGVTFYTIDVDRVTTGQGPGWSELMKSIARVSGGEYFDVTSGDAGRAISDAVSKALSEIQAVDSVFTSVSMPVSANAQGNYANQVYIGMFRPDGGAHPLWRGNLKQYQLGRLDGELRLVDADVSDAINSLTGGITECARSFWTPSTADAYWAFDPAGECIPLGLDADLYASSNFPDGSIVEKGAQGYVLRASAPSGRSLMTCSPTSCTSLTTFNTANGDITQAGLGASSAAERDDLINWARGQDIDDENRNGNTSEMRPSAHGDVVHSRPLAMDFGTANSPAVVVFYGGNDGMLRAANGNQSTNIASASAGSELWAFMPPEFYGNIKRLRDNDVKVKFPNVTAPDAQPKPYGMDGPLTVHRDSSETWIYAAMRRGGRALYAFSVANNDPANVTLKWRKGCPENFAAPGVVSDTGCDTGFTGIGQTWSAASVFKASGYGTGGAPLLIMGGGYDTCEDSDPHVCTSATKGNKIYVLDADDGSLLQTLDTDRSVVADIVIVPDATTGLAKYAYTADLGGNVYRVNIGAEAPGNWTITKVASVGCATIAACPANRKFMFAPDILEVNGEYVLLLGSGDREKPLRYYAVATSVSNYFFMLRDRPEDPNWLSDEATACGAALMCLQSLLGITTADDPSPTDLAAKKGWYLGLRSSEQVVTAALTIFGTVTFSTHTPDVPVPGVCTSKLGTARVYNISFANAASTRTLPDRSAELPPATGLPPSPVAGMVQVGEELIAVCFGCGLESAIAPEEPPIPPAVLQNQPKGRVYWYIER
jgi:type IV pilus assembly protein PilY1